MHYQQWFCVKLGSNGVLNPMLCNKIREEYIKALKLADEHEYSLLLEFVRS
jgi:hypothetical protein